MKQFQIPNYLVILVQLSVKKVQCRIQVRNDFSEIFEANNGLCQGNALSCILFNIALEKVIK